MKIERVELDGPFTVSFIDEAGGCHMLHLDGGEWRLDYLWVAQGRVDRWGAIARAARIIEGWDKAPS